MRLVTFTGDVYQPMYEHNDKQYIRITLDEKGAEVVRRFQESKAYLVRFPKFDNPLEGRVLTVKVPYRYRRVMCEVEGGVPIQALEKGAPVQVDLEFTGVWNKEGYSGYTWKMKKLKSI